MHTPSSQGGGEMCYSVELQEAFASFRPNFALQLKKKKVFH